MTNISAEVLQIGAEKRNGAVAGRKGSVVLASHDISDLRASTIISPEATPRPISAVKSWSPQASGQSPMYAQRPVILYADLSI